MAEALRQTAAELQGYDRHGQRPALTMSTGLPLEDLLQDVSGTRDRAAVQAAVTQATQRPAEAVRQRQATSTAHNGPQATATGEVVPPDKPPETRSPARGTRREPPPAAPEAADTPPQGESPPPPQLSSEDLFQREEREAAEQGEKDRNA